MEHRLLRTLPQAQFDAPRGNRSLFNWIASFPSSLEFRFSSDQESKFPVDRKFKRPLAHEGVTFPDPGESNQEMSPGSEFPSGFGGDPWNRAFMVRGSRLIRTPCSCQGRGEQILRVTATDLRECTGSRAHRFVQRTWSAASWRF